MILLENILFYLLCHQVPIDSHLSNNTIKWFDTITEIILIFDKMIQTMPAIASNDHNLKYNDFRIPITRVK